LIWGGGGGRGKIQYYRKVQRITTRIVKQENKNKEHNKRTDEIISLETKP